MIHYMNEQIEYIHVVNSFNEWTQIDLRNIIHIQIN